MATNERYGVGVVDTLVHLPVPEDESAYTAFEDGLSRDRGSSKKSPIGYLFKDRPVLPQGADPVDYTIAEMDRFGIEHAVLGLGSDPQAQGALERYPDRFIGSVMVDPTEGMEAVRRLERAHAEHGVRAAAFFPAFTAGQVAINDKRAYPVYAKCVELDLPIFVSVGIPGPRVTMDTQRVELLDEVCWFFPELKIVMRHGGEPWVDMAVRLMLKWPNLHYSTSAFAPKRYPEEVVHFLNTRGREKVIFAGYYAVGLTWDRIFSDFAELGLRDEVWPRFLRQNALSVLGIPDAGAEGESPEQEVSAPSA